MKGYITNFNSKLGHGRIKDNNNINYFFRVGSIISREKKKNERCDIVRGRVVVFDCENCPQISVDINVDIPSLTAINIKLLGNIKALPRFGVCTYKCKACGDIVKRKGKKGVIGCQACGDIMLKVRE